MQCPKDATAFIHGSYYKLPDLCKPEDKAWRHNGFSWLLSQKTCAEVLEIIEEEKAAQNKTQDSGRGLGNPVISTLFESERPMTAMEIGDLLGKNGKIVSVDLNRHKDKYVRKGEKAICSVTGHKATTWLPIRDWEAA